MAYTELKIIFVNDNFRRRQSSASRVPSGPESETTAQQHTGIVFDQADPANSEISIVVAAAA